MKMKNLIVYFIFSFCVILSRFQFCLSILQKSREKYSNKIEKTKKKKSKNYRIAKKQKSYRRIKNKQHEK